MFGAEIEDKLVGLWHVPDGEKKLLPRHILNFWRTISSLGWGTSLSVYKRNLSPCKTMPLNTA